MLFPFLLLIHPSLVVEVNNDYYESDYSIYENYPRRITIYDNKRVDYDINISLNQERYGYSNEEI
jgi:hypothetical protein